MRVKIGTVMNEKPRASSELTEYSVASLSNRLNMRSLRPHRARRRRDPHQDTRYLVAQRHDMPAQAGALRPQQQMIEDPARARIVIRGIVDPEDFSCLDYDLPPVSR